MQEDLREIEKLYDILRDSDHVYHAAAVEYVYKTRQYIVNMGPEICFNGYHDHDGNQCICWINVTGDISKEIEAAELIRQVDFLKWADEKWRQYIEIGMV